MLVAGHTLQYKAAFFSPAVSIDPPSRVSKTYRYVYARAQTHKTRQRGSERRPVRRRE